MCGGIYEEDFKDDLLPDKPVRKRKEHRRVKSTDGWMNDLEFTTAEDFMKQQEDRYYYPGSDPQT